MKVMLIIKADNAFSNGIRIYESLSRLGHEVHIASFGKSEGDYAARYKKFKPDFVLQTGIGYPKCDLEVQKSLKDLGAKLVMWYPDAYWLFQEPSRSYFLDAFNVFNLFLVTMKGHVEVSKSYTDKVVWAPHYFDSTFFKTDKDIKQENDVVFIGGKTLVSPQREEYLKELEKKYKLKVVGYGFTINGKETETEWEGEHIAEIYKSSKIGLNIISGGIFNCDLQFSARVYKVMGCKCFLLTEYIPNIETMFVPGIHLDVFYTKEEMIEKIDYYLKHEDEREKIAEQGYQEVMKKHDIDKTLNATSQTTQLTEAQLSGGSTLFVDLSPRSLWTCKCALASLLVVPLPGMSVCLAVCSLPQLFLFSTVLHNHSQKYSSCS